MIFSKKLAPFWDHALGAQDRRGVSLIPLSFEDTRGFQRETIHLEAFRVFVRSCAVIVEKTPPLRKGVAASAALEAIAHAALRQEDVNAAQARRFFEAHFRLFHISAHGPGVDNKGFLTGYYEPIVEGSLTASRDFTAPVLARPDNLEVSFALSHPRHDRGWRH